MKNQLLDLLKKLGMPESYIKIIQDRFDSAEAVAEFDVDKAVLEYKTSQMEIFKNDGEYITKVQSDERAKQTDITLRKLKQTFGLSPEEVKDKTIEELFKIAKAKATLSADASVNDLQTELTEANIKIKKLEEEEIPMIKSSAEKEKQTFFINNKVRAKLKPEVLRVPFDAAFPLLDMRLKEKYDLTLDETGEVVVLDKGKTTRPKSADGTKLLVLDDIVESFIVENKFKKESGAPDKDKPLAPIELDKEQKEKIAKNPHLQKAVKNLEEVKAMPQETK